MVALTSPELPAHESKNPAHLLAFTVRHTCFAGHGCGKRCRSPTPAAKKKLVFWFVWNRIRSCSITTETLCYLIPIRAPEINLISGAVID
jgi:hypothetical protein